MNLFESPEECRRDGPGAGFKLTQNERRLRVVELMAVRDWLAWHTCLVFLAVVIGTGLFWLAAFALCDRFVIVLEVR